VSAQQTRVRCQLLLLVPAEAEHKETAMPHKYSTGAEVYYDPKFGNQAARGKYKIVRQLPVENDNKLSYRIKSIAESFERIAEEHQLSRDE
jgi:hypothetical protein